MHFIELTDKISGKRHLVNLNVDCFEEAGDGVNIRRSAAGFWFTCAESWEEVCQLILEAGGKIGKNEKQYDSAD